MTTRVKICGITRLEDALAAVEAGADALGFVFAPSPRRVGPAQVREITLRLPPFVRAVGVFRDALADEVEAIVEEAGLDAVQLHGDETPEYCGRMRRPVLKRFRVADNDQPDELRSRTAGYAVAACLLDPGAGSGRTFAWELARAPRLPVIVAGGLTPDNVAAAVRAARPYAVDACSGLELTPGIKDADKLREFVRAVRREDARDAAR